MSWGNELILSLFLSFRQVAAQVKHLVAAEESQFIINHQVAALSRANPGVSSAFLFADGGPISTADLNRIEASSTASGAEISVAV